MATKGRPLSLKTIIKTLRAIAADLRADPDPDVQADADVLIDVAEGLAVSPTGPSAKTVRFAIKHVDEFATRYENWLGESTAAHLTKCIDSLVLMGHKLRQGASQGTTGASQTMPAADIDPTGGSTTDMMANIAARAREAASADPLRDAAVEAIVGTLAVLLDEIADGDRPASTFTTIRHLVDVLERLSS